MLSQLATKPRDGPLRVIDIFRRSDIPLLRTTFVLMMIVVNNDVASKESRELHLESGRITRLKGPRQPQPTGSDTYQASLMQPEVVMARVTPVLPSQSVRCLSSEHGDF